MSASHNQYKKFWWIIGILVSFNVLLLAGVFWWISSFQPPHPPPGGRPVPMNFLEEELNMSTQQQEQYRKLKAEHRQKIQKIQKELGQLKNTFFGQMGQQQGFPDSLNQLIGQKHSQMDELTYHHFVYIRQNICTEEQRAKFDDVILQALRRGPPGRRKGPMGKGRH
ncbi:MAG: hypothetical protein AAFV95_26630 [Bacteroidota bacterium]